MLPLWKLHQQRIDVAQELFLYSAGKPPDVQERERQLPSETSWGSPELHKSNDKGCWGAELSHYI